MDNEDVEFIQELLSFHTITGYTNAGKFYLSNGVQFLFEHIGNYHLLVLIDESGWLEDTQNGPVKVVLTTNGGMTILKMIGETKDNWTQLIPNLNLPDSEIHMVIEGNIISLTNEQ